MQIEWELWRYVSNRIGVPINRMLEFSRATLGIAEEPLEHAPGLVTSPHGVLQ